MSIHSEAALSDEAKDAHLRHFRPSDGELVPLIIQSFDQEDRLQRTSQWTRLGRPVNQVPSLQILSYWILAPVLGREGDPELILTPSSIGSTALRLITSAPLTIALLSGVTHGLGAFRISWLPQSPVTKPDDRYDEVHIPRRNLTPSRRFIDSETDSVSLRSQDSREGDPLSRATRLCMVKDASKKTYEMISAPPDTDTAFVFISYAKTQFNVATDAAIDSLNYPAEEAREAHRQLARRDRETLIDWGIHAAQAAGVQAFWLDFECSHEDSTSSQSSARMEHETCRIARAAHSIAIAVGPPVAERVSSLMAGAEPPEKASERTIQWLRHWGSATWSLPQFLLSCKGQDVGLYVLSDPEEPKVLAKQDVAELAWEDARPIVKELAAHFDGTRELSPSLLVQLALEYFSLTNTSPFNSWDVVYAIISLFPNHQIPATHPTDSPFRWFARFIMDFEPKGSLLERMICGRPQESKQDGLTFGGDAHDTKPREIRPVFRIDEITDADAVILDRVPAASICWDQIPAAPSLNLGSSFTRRLVGISLSLAMAMPLFRAYFSQVYLYFSNPNLDLVRVLFNFVNVGARYTAGVALVMPLFFLKTKSPSANHERYATFAFLGLAFYLSSGLVAELLVVLGLAVFQRIANDVTATGALISGLFFQTTPLAFFLGAKTHDSPAKAHLIGIEGFADRATVERHIWGRDFGRLTQCSSREMDTEVSGVDFTLVDTYARTMTYIRSRKPPVAMFLCGEDGDAQRALLCSYDHHTGTCHREKALNVASRVGQRMHSAQSPILSLNAMPEYAEPEMKSARNDVPDDEMQPPLQTTSLSDKTNFMAGRKRRRFIPSGFLFVTLLGARMFGLTQYHSNKGKEEAYYTGFLLVQPLAYFLVHRRIFTRVVIPAAYWYEILFSLYSLSNISYYKNVARYKPLLEGLMGTAAGLMFPLLVMYTWSCFSTRQQPIRMVVWSVLGSQVFNLLNWFDPFLYRLGQLFLAGVMFFIGTMGADYIGLPKDMPGLETAERVARFRHSALAQHAVLGTVDEGLASISIKALLRLRPSRHQWIRSVLIFFLSAISGTHIWRDRTRGLDRASLEIMVTVAMAVVGLLLATLPRLQRGVIIFCQLFPSAAFFARLFRVRKGVPGITVHILCRMNVFVHPLLLASIVGESESWADAAFTLFSSMTGWGLARLVSAIYYPLIPPPAVLVPQAILFAILWVYQARRKKRAASMAHVGSVGTEYRDSVEIDSLS